MHPPLLTLASTPFRDGTVRRFLFVAAIGFWLGGFTFYGSVVIPTGVEVLHGHLKQGFITQQVTAWLNLSGAVALPVLLWNGIALWPMRGRVTRWGLAATWIIMAVVQVELFALHPFMDRLLDGHKQQITDYDRFDLLHRVYILSATVQWAAGVVHVWCAVADSRM